MGLYFSIENIDGSDHADVLIGDSLDNALNGERGDDVIKGGAGNDRLFGAEGNDQMYGEDGNDFFTGYEGAELMDGGAGIDTVAYSHPYNHGGVYVNLQTGMGQENAAEGDRYVNIENIIGTDSSDVLMGNASNNILEGLKGNDTIIGGDGNDILKSGGGNDMLVGGEGWDELYGDAGADKLTGGAGQDRFVYSKSTESTNSAFDTITDFIRGEDKIDLTALKGVGIRDFSNLKITQDTTTHHTIITAADNLHLDYRVDLAGELNLTNNDFIFGV